MNRGSFRRWMNEVEADPRYWTERAILRVSEEISLAMERSGVSRAELSRRLGASPAYVTKILRGNVNFTIDSLARIAHALGGEFRFHVAPKDATTRWIDVVGHVWAHEIDWDRGLAAASSAGPQSWRSLSEFAYPANDIAAEEVREVSHVATAAAA